MDGEREENVEGWVDILGSGAVLKKVVVVGKGQDTPEFKQQAFVHFQARLSGAEGEYWSGCLESLIFADCSFCVFKGDIVQDTRDEFGVEKPVEVIIGDNVLEQVVPGVMLAVRMMKQGEVCDVKVNHRFAYAERGFPPLIGPNQDLEYRLELIRIGDFEKEPVDMTPEELIEVVKKRKDRGNYFVEIDRLGQAMHCYQDGIKKAESHLPKAPAGQEDDLEFDPEDPYNANPELIKLRAQCVGNIAHCLEKQEKLVEAKEACVAALALEPTNLKILLRAARISMTQGELKEAKACLAAAKQHHGDEPAIFKEMHAYKIKLEEQRQKEKKLSGFLGQAAKENVTVSQVENSKVEEKEAAVEPEQSSSEVQKAWLVSRVLKIVIFFAPTILATLVFLMLPTQAEGRVHWAGSVSALPCAGSYYPAKCCICRQAILQAELRQKKVAEMFPGRELQVGFRAERKLFIPYERSDVALLPVLEKICARLPVDVPKGLSEETIETLKVSIAITCEGMLDEFHDKILDTLKKDWSAESQGLMEQICQGVTKMCPKPASWAERIASLGSGYVGVPCRICQSASEMIKSSSATEKDLRDPNRLCSQLRVTIPARETNTGRVSKLVGEACVALIHENHFFILRGDDICQQYC